MAHTLPGATGAVQPIFVTQQRKVRDFLADQDKLATIKSDWLYQIGSAETRERLLRAQGFTPVRAHEFRGFARHGSFAAV